MRLVSIYEKASYFLWALRYIKTKDFVCPSCGNANTTVIRRKALVTSLRECSACGLRFRVPKGNPEAAIRFYQTRYKQDFTTTCPSAKELEKLLETHFHGSPKDYSNYIQVLEAVGLRPGDTILDFGCSWGYGSWQLQKIGFQVYSYEVSKPRATYAATRLGCNMVDDTSQLPTVKCFFSAHVIEHLPNPNIMWTVANQVLNPGGITVCFTPNGEPHLEHDAARQYHQLWGNVHPLLLTSRALQEMSHRYGFVPYVFSSPYSVEKLGLLEQEKTLNGSELLLVALRNNI